jgi:cytoskeletal protein CcmA (bactofilin family)
MAEEPDKKPEQSGADNKGDVLSDNPDALNSNYEAPDAEIDPREIKRSFADRVKNLTTNFNIYLIAFLVIVFIALVITYVALNTNQQSTTTISGQDLNEEAFKELAQNESNVGDVNQTLTVEANAIFNGKVLVKDNLDVAGSINVGGPLTLPGITVAGTSAFEDVEVNNNLAILGNASIQGTLSVNDSVNVTGNLSVGGEISASRVTADRIEFTGDLSISRHFDSGGPAPSVSRGGSVGAGGTVSISGTDVSGTVTINTGGGPSTGTLAIVRFAQSYTGTPRVIISPASAPAASLDYYVTRTTTGFEVRTTSAPNSSSTYVFDFWVSE